MINCKIFCKSGPSFRTSRGRKPRGSAYLCSSGKWPLKSRCVEYTLKNSHGSSMVLSQLLMLTETKQQVRPSIEITPTPNYAWPVKICRLCQELKCYAKHLCCRSFCSKVIIHTHRHICILPTALSVPLQWSAHRRLMIISVVTSMVSSWWAYRSTWRMEFM